MLLGVASCECGDRVAARDNKPRFERNCSAAVGISALTGDCVRVHARVAIVLRLRVNGYEGRRESPSGGWEDVLERSLARNITAALVRGSMPLPRATCSFMKMAWTCFSTARLVCDRFVAHAGCHVSEHLVLASGQV